ncbi:TetR/AcrR family transcriptional regulator [Bacillus cereus]|uniref:TetR/AcrR family transcriptional regulator n=1 Tax=Bacillus cereus TaxID=1396 RepID=UPI00062DA95F|nr:TetR/AcrR family transcriptional regulator [Bacillus cereus]KLA22707.1 hypothetical protein B4080_5578 [Bacillus cereus]
MNQIRKSARQKILDVASELFYNEGIRAVGVDKIVEVSGVSKGTLYRHFPSKDDLIIAYLEEKSESLWVQFNDAVSAYEGSPRMQIFALVESINALLTEPGIRGCVFLNAHAEFSNQNPIQHLVQKHTEALRNLLQRLTKEAGASDDTLADQLLLVINGAFSTAPIVGADISGEQLKKVSACLIDLHLNQ